MEFALLCSYGWRFVLTELKQQNDKPIGKVELTFRPEI